MPWRIVPLMMVFVALAHFNRVSISVAGTEQIIPSELLSTKKMGLVYSAFLLLYTLFMIPGGWFIDRFGPRIGWMVVGFGSAAGALLTGVAGLTLLAPMSLLAGLLVVRSVMGCTNAPLHPSGARLVANWVPPGGASLANGLLNCAACVGMAATPQVFGLLIDRLGWPAAFQAAGVATIGVAIVWTIAAADHPPIRLVRPQVDEPAAVSPRAIDFVLPTRLISLLRDRSLMCLTISYGMVGYFQYLFFYWAQHYFENVQKMPKDTSRLITGLLTLSMGAGMVVGGWLSDRAPAFFGPRRGLAVVPVVGLLLGAVATTLGVLDPDPAVIGVYFALAMAAVGLGEGSFWTAAVRIGGARGGTGAAILNTGGNAGGLLAPALTPFISDQFGWQVGLGVASVVCVLGAALWVGVTPASR